jgi:hypothetical protein
MSCPERKQLLDSFSAAFDRFSAAVRESKANPPAQNPSDLQQSSVEAQVACERLWAQLQEHQSKHQCWRPDRGRAKPV